MAKGRARSGESSGDLRRDGPGEVGSAMPNFLALEKYPREVHAIGDWRLPRPQTITQLLVSLALALVLAAKIADPLFGSQAAIITFCAVAFFTPGAIAGMEAATGRHPIMEIYAWAKFYLTTPRYYVGSRPARPKERARLKAMFRAERELAGEESAGLFGYARHYFRRTVAAYRGEKRRVVG